jgi:hypothetical protein
MKVTVTDAGNYFRGLLVLVARDRRISNEEVDLMHHVGKTLGFEKRFYENAVNEILENTFIVTLPPVFSSKKLAQCFILDGFQVAASDGDIHSFEEEFLRSSAELNGLALEWFAREKAKIISGGIRDSHMEVDNMIVE